MSYGNKEDYEYEWPGDDDGGDGWGDDGGEDGDGWGDENEDLGPEVEIENSYYEGEAAMRDRPQEALDHFIKCAKLEKEQGNGVNHGFKATRNIVICAARLNKVDVMMNNMAEVINMMNEVSLNDFDEGISGILDAVTRYQT